MKVVAGHSHSLLLTFVVRSVEGVHHLFLDRPDETLRAIVSFLRGPAGTSPR
ncbi:MAG TPA: hypothetical protein VF461_02115 [Gemmatimonadaceae bacterium]